MAITVAGKGKGRRRGRYTRDERIRLARLTTKLFELWGLELCTQAVLLGLSPASRATLTRYRSGHPLADQPDRLERVGHLLGIHKCLQMLYPLNPELRHSWVGARNQRLDGHAPVEIMLRDGLPGIVAVRVLTEEMCRDH
ncbi:MAG: hypothetical protein VYC42_08970 [Pseudomonadota bacterium]|nr:hypothetical protein [Pseudomonadota bacterium]